MQKMQAEFGEKKKVLMANQQKWLNEELQRVNQNGETGLGTYWTAMKTSTAKLKDAMAKEQRDLVQKYGVQQVWGAQQLNVS